MFVPNAPPDSADNLSAADAVQQAVLRNLGGESLEGSGFEHETPDPQFQFDWTRLDQTPGGLR
jgi:hypothetical protein